MLRLKMTSSSCASWKTPFPALRNCWRRTAWRFSTASVCIKAARQARPTAYNRVLEAEGELRQIITSICQNYSAYPATVNDCGSRLHPNYDAYASSLAQAAGNLAASENAAGANFTVSVVSTYQICIRVCDPDGNPVNGAAVTVTNQLNNSRKQAATDPKGNAVFWVGDLGAGELAKPE